MAKQLFLEHARALGQTGCDRWSRVTPDYTRLQDAFLFSQPGYLLGVTNPI